MFHPPPIIRASVFQSKKANMEDFNNYSKKAHTEMELTMRNGECGISKYQGRDDRATSEQVLDPRTRMMLFRLLNSGYLKKLQGCISTGKEANVYHANAASDDMECAVKVFKTAILVFKDRDRYVSGEFRFRHGYCKSNPRKMVKLWAEKEMRNLKRLHSKGIRCPLPLMLKSHILIMQFIGTNGWPAPRLKDAVLSRKKCRETYLDCIKMMRRMYQLCHLVHGDLSEYNILYYNGEIYFIDVSQSVEFEHPCASEFLRKDCRNITEFYRKKNCMVPMTTEELYNFVTMDADMTEEQVDEYLEHMQLKIQERDNEATNEEQVDAAVFMNTYIPRSLTEVLQSEKQQLDFYHGKTEQSLANAIEGLGIVDQSISFSDLEDCTSEDSEESDSDSDDSDMDVDAVRLQKRIFREEKRTERLRLEQEERQAQKENKKVVKEEKREKRQNKIKKHIKKRHKKISKQKK